MAHISFAHNPHNISQAVSDALRPIDISSLVKNKWVAIKPNETYATSTNQTGVTQRETLQAVIRAIKAGNPSRITVSGGSGAAETAEVMKVTGMMAVVKDEAVEFFDHNRGPFKKISLTYPDYKEISGPQKQVMVNPQVLEYECLISLAQLKLHETATVTLSMKNVAMSYPAADYYGHPRGSYKRPHHFFEDMHSFIAAMIKRFPIDLAIISGFPAMIGTGPLNGHAFNSGLVIASTDAVAADTAGARVLGFDAQAVRHLWEAGRWGLGETDIYKMNFPQLSLSQAYSLFTQAAFGQAIPLNHS